MIERITRTYEYDDPNGIAAQVAEMSGAEMCEAWMRGDWVIPVTATVGYDIVSYGDGEIELICEPGSHQFNPYGIMHGGPIATLLDTAAGVAVHTTLPKGTGYTTLDLISHYLRPITLDTGPLTVRGRVTSGGRRVAVSEAEITNAEGKKLATATSTCLILAIG